MKVDQVRDRIIKHAPAAAELIVAFSEWLIFLGRALGAPAGGAPKPQETPRKPAEAPLGDDNIITAEEICQQMGCHVGVLKAFTRGERQWLVRTGPKRFVRASFEAHKDDIHQYVTRAKTLELVKKRRSGGETEGGSRD